MGGEYKCVYDGQRFRMPRLVRLHERARVHQDHSACGGLVIVDIILFMVAIKSS